MKLVVVLSGGGAKGSYQVGVMESLAKMGLDNHIAAYTGVSVGSLNAALAAQHGMGNLDPIWRDIRSRDVYKKYSKLRSAWRLATSGGSRSAAPLRDLIDLHVEIGVGKPSYAGAANIDTGEYETFASTDANYKDGLIASSAIPAVIPPVKIGPHRYWDGGVLNMTPLGHALSLNPDGLIIITCNPYPVSKKEPVKGGLEGLELVKRAIGMLVDEGFESDLREFISRNDQDGFRHIPYTLISPNVSLGDSDDFSRKLYDARRFKGMIDGNASAFDLQYMINMAAASS